MATQSKYVCVVNRNRDGYQVPLALKEAGLLDTLVTDFYAPDTPPSWLPAILLQRHVDGLGRSDVTGCWPSFAWQVVGEKFRMPKKLMYRVGDRLLARKAAARARANGSAIYSYAGYLPGPGETAPGTKLIDFEFHPHPALGWEILSEDARRYPEVAWSIAREEESLRRTDVTEGWKVADAIVCASRMTRRSLEHVGCAPERITVVPYAFGPVPTTVERRPDGPCRFLFVGQGIQRKGLHHLIRCWRKLGLKDASLTIVCYYVDPGIAALAQEAGIEITGRQDRAALQALYRTADVFVMPSLVEGFGLVYLEALSVGCHVIGTENTGLPELPLSADAMTILPQGDLDALEAALKRCAELKAAGLIDARAIAAEAGKWQWRQFREAIAAHARQVLA